MGDSIFGGTLDGYSNAFVFGTGGGNDIVSSVLVAMYLQREGIRTDIGGILSPAAIHTFDGYLEQVVNKINGDVRRTLHTKEQREISFIDGVLPQYASEVGIAIGGFYDLSIRYGTDSLVEGVDCLLKRNRYDLVVAVDMGGDILARGVQDPTLLSPAMDFTSLYLLSKLDVDSVLVEFGLGTDGELRTEGMAEILDELRGSGLILHEDKIAGSDKEVIKFNELFGLIKQTRVGHATMMTLNTLTTDTLDDDIVTQYRFMSRVGEKKWLTPFEVVLPHEYFGSMYIIDGKGLADQRKQTAQPYRNPLEMYVRLKQVPSWKTELDLLYLWSGDDWTTPKQDGHCMLLLAPSKQIDKSARGEIIQEGIAQLVSDQCDLALVLDEDMRYISSESFHSINADRFCLVSSKDAVKDFAVKTAKDIVWYQAKYS